MTAYRLTALRMTAAFALAGFAIGCGSSQPSFKTDGYYDGDHAYFVGASDGSGAILPAGQWALDNYEVIDGTVGARRDTEGYAVWQKFDLDGDGTFETESRQSLYDLLLVERGGKGRIAIHSEALPEAKRNLGLEALVDEYVQAVAKSGMLPASLGKPYAEAATPYVTQIERTIAGTLDGVPAYEVTFAFAPSADAMDAGQRARVVIADPGLVSRLGDKTLKAVLIASYTNTPAAFDAGLETFDGFLDRVALLTHEEVVHTRTRQIFDCRGLDDTIEVAVTLNAQAKVSSAVDRKPGETVVDDGRTCASVVLVDAPFRQVPPQTFQLELTRNPPPPPTGDYVRDEPPPPPVIEPEPAPVEPAPVEPEPAPEPPPKAGRRAVPKTKAAAAPAPAPAPPASQLPPPPPPEPAP